MNFIAFEWLLVKKINLNILSYHIHGMTIYGMAIYDHI